MATVDVYRTLWRHRFFIVGMTALIGGVALFVTSLQPKIYEATALVRVQQKITTAGDAFGSLEVGTRLAQTYAKIVTTRALQQRVAASLAGKVEPADISIGSAPVSDVELLQVSARSESPRSAALVANAATVALRSFIADTGTLRDQVIVVDPASVPSTPVSPRMKLTVALALLLGLILNGALVLLAGYLADPLPEQAEMEAVFGVPVLASIPRLSFPKGGAIRPPQPGQQASAQRAPVLSSERGT
jgi:capsular polysaccharide biosynthesis protein